MTKQSFDRYFKRQTPQPITTPTAFDVIEDTPVSVDALIDILSLRRVAHGPAETTMIERYIAPLKPEQDKYGNYFLTMLDAQGNEPTVAFTAHTDTVHSDLPTTTSEDTHVQNQKVKIGNHMAKLTDPFEDCLGADDGTGIWILLNLIKAGVPGLYCFYRDEETGRNGSEWSARYNAERYASIDMMLSFDRRGTTDIITHQMGERCCSELFAEHVASAIDSQCYPDDTGSFTDSYSFMHLIPECTNVCVGYYAQHTGMERQDLTWAAYLVNQLIAINWSIVPVERDPQAADDLSHYTMADLLETCPDEVASILEEYMGLTFEDLLVMVADEQFTTTTSVLKTVDTVIASREGDFFGPSPFPGLESLDDYPYDAEMDDFT
jgi:hypothetical protein